MYKTSDEALDAYREELYSYYSDISKEAYGFRCRLDLSGMSCHDIDLAIEQMEFMANVAREEQEQYHDVCDERFERNIESIINLGAKDRATAIRWIVDANDLGEEWDAGYIEYSFGLTYGKYNEELTRSMLEVAHP